MHLHALLYTVLETFSIAFISSIRPEVRNPFLKGPDRKYFKLVALQSLMQPLRSDAVARKHSLTMYERMSLADPIEPYY